MKKSVWLLAWALTLPAVAAFRPVIAIRGAHVITGTGTDLAAGTVIVRNGLIEDVGATAAIPPGATIIDGTGLTVYPGFIDGVSTWGIASAAPPPATNTGASASPQTPSPQPATPAQPRAHGPEDRPQTYAYERAADLVVPTDSRLEAARAAGFTSAATFPNRGIVEGLGAMVDLAGEHGRDMVVAQPLGEQIVLRTGSGRAGFPASLMGNIAYVRQLHLDEQQAAEAQKIYTAHPQGTERPEYDHNLTALQESPRLLLPADEEQQIDRMLAFAQELKSPVVLYGLHEAFRRVDELKAAKVPIFISLKWPEKPRDGDPHEVPNYRDLLLRDQAPAVPGLLAKAGVKFGFFSDGLATAPELKKAVKKALDAGLSSADAVKALTLNTAEIYGVADRMGSVEKGKIANLVVTKGDIFEDKPNIQYVFIDGREFRPSEETQKGPPAPRPGAAATASNPAPQEVSE